MMHPLPQKLNPTKKIYFASDFHLGTPTLEASRQRENDIVRWLNHVSEDAQCIVLLGDIFDFWFEYRHVVPKGFVRLLGKLAQLSDQGIQVVIFTGNHDMWMFDYFPKELGIEVIGQPLSITINSKKFHIGHGDGLGPGDKTYKVLKKVFRSKVCQWLFARLHPNLGMGIAHAWSGESRKSNEKKEEKTISHFHDMVFEFGFFHA